MKCGIVISNEKPLLETLDLVLSDIAHLVKASTAGHGIREVANGHADFVILDSSVRDNDTAAAVRTLLQTQR